MKKGTLFAYVLGILGGLLLALGMVFTLVESTELFTFGLVVGIIGLIFLALVYPLYRKSIGKPFNKVRKGAIGLSIFGTFSLLLLGAGMSMTMVYDDLFTIGIVVGGVGVLSTVLFIFKLVGFLGHPVKLNHDQKRAITFGTIYSVILLVAAGLFLSNPVFNNTLNIVAIAIGFVAFAGTLLNGVFYKYRVSNKGGK